MSRYIAIVYPLKQHLSKKQTLIAIAGIWLLAALVAFPQYQFSILHTAYFYDIEHDYLKGYRLCNADNYPDGKAVQGKQYQL